MQPPKNPSKVLKIAVVGTGYRSDAHLSTITKLSDLYRLTAVCDAMPERAREAAQRYSVSEYVDLETMLQQERPDVVLVTVAPEAHHTVASLAARYGAHILCETPISITQGFADQMVRSAEEHGVKLEITENVWRWPHERFKRMLVDDGMIGEIRTARLWYTSGSYHGINGVRTLVNSEVRRVVGMAKVMETHLGRRGMNPYHFRVFGPQGAEVPPRFEETTVATWEAGLFEFENGAMATYEFPISSRPKGNLWEIHGTKGYISGTDVVTENPRRAYRIVTETEEEKGEKVVTRVRLYEGENPVPGLVWENPFLHYKPSDADDVARMDQLIGMYRAATEGIAPEYGAVNARRDLEVLLAVAESALLGNHPIELPLTHETNYEKRLASYFESELQRPS